MRQLLREGWERDIRFTLKDKIPQDVVAQGVKDRGYAKGWSEEEHAARQIAKCLEELGELAECFHLPDEFRALVVSTGRKAREMFDNEELWRQADGARLREGAAGKATEEAADSLVPLFALADALGFDIAAEAVRKSRDDVPRGKRVS
jgi:hypothetical protein